MQIACAAEGREYVAHSAAMLHSVLAQHAAGSVRVTYMHGPDVSARDRRLLAGMVEEAGGEIRYLRIPNRWLRGLPTKGFTRRATWYRVFLPELLPEVDTILYLDSDLIVLAPLEELARTELNGSWVGAVTNVFQHNHLHRPAELGLAGPHVYFNAGVLLMNLAAMREDRCTQALVDYGRSHAAALEWRDQDALNVVLGERRLPLHPRWNCMNSVLYFDSARAVFGSDAVDEARRSPAIRHFEGPDANKPWHERCDSELRELYNEHRRHTPWPSARRARVSLGRRGAVAA
ncbi:MAG TPA: glycosyltransferase family 8 protein [Thermoleophilaceae bacterium]|nr:glycosyltransferase family 8 protein [Thermoleophilaceae bacterium]